MILGNISVPTAVSKATSPNYKKDQFIRSPALRGKKAGDFYKTT